MSIRYRGGASTRFIKPIFPLRDSSISDDIRKPPVYENPSEDPTVREVMVFCIFQEMRALESVQNKNTTPLDDVKMAKDMLFGEHKEEPRGWVDY